MENPRPAKGLAAESDDRLVFLSVTGNEEATAVLIVRYLGVINKIAARFQANGIEHEDFVQEGMIGFLSAVKSFRASHGCSFNTYARICVLNRIKKSVDFVSTTKYSLLSNAAAIDQAEQESGLNARDPELLLLERETVDWFSKEIGELLSVTERKVFLLYLEGYEPGQISEITKVSVKSVYNSLGRVRKKLRAAFESVQNG